MSSTTTSLDTNVVFLVSCITASGIDLDFNEISRHMGTSRLTERARFTALAARVEDDNATSPPIPIRSVGFTELNVPVNDQCYYLIMAIQLSGEDPDFSRVAAANGTSRATARMRFERLDRAVHERMARDTDSDMEIPFR